MRAFTSRSFAASKHFARAGWCGRCRRCARASAASVRSVTCWRRRKPGDAILGVRIPPAAEKLRRLANLAQIVQSHALSFFHLSSPDLLLGFDAPPEQRNIFALASSHPDMARAGIRLRGYGQSVLAAAHRQTHPFVLGGARRRSLASYARSALGAELRSRRADRCHAARHRGLSDRHLGRFEAEVRSFGVFPSYFLGLVGSDGTWETYDGELRLIDSQGATVDSDSARHVCRVAW